MMKAESVRCYSLQVDDRGRIVGEDGDAGQRLVDLAHDFARQHNVDFNAAMRRVRELPEGQALLKSYGEASQYVGFNQHGEVRSFTQRRYRDPAAELVRRIDAKRVSDPACAKRSYSVLAQEALRSDPQLAAEYGSYITVGDR